jgi:hypothetical protein
LFKRLVGGTQSKAKACITCLALHFAMAHVLPAVEPDQTNSSQEIPSPPVPPTSTNPTVGKHQSQNPNREIRPLLGEVRSRTAAITPRPNSRAPAPAPGSAPADHGGRLRQIRRGGKPLLPHHHLIPLRRRHRRRLSRIWSPRLSSQVLEAFGVDPTKGLSDSQVLLLTSEPSVMRISVWVTGIMLD